MKNKSAVALGKRSAKIRLKKLGKKKFVEQMSDIAQKRWDNKDDRQSSEDVDNPI